MANGIISAEHERRFGTDDAEPPVASAECDPPQDVIFVRGPSGSGKTTLVSMLRERFHYGATIEVDTLRAMIHDVDWWAGKQHREAACAAAGVALRYLQSGQRPVVLADTFPSRILEVVVDLVRGYGRTAIVSLCASTPVLARRLALRHKGRVRSAAALRVASSMAGACEPWGLLHRQALPSGIDSRWTATEFHYAAWTRFRGVPFYSIDTTTIGRSAVIESALALLRYRDADTPSASSANSEAVTRGGCGSHSMSLAAAAAEATVGTA